MFTQPNLLIKYNQKVPRYTSYPTALQLSPSFSRTQLEQAMQKNASQAVSIYVHIPFCRQLCYYCGCNKVVTRHQDKADVYLDALEKEMQNRSDAFSNRGVTSLHFGGGSPNFLNKAQFHRLFCMLRRHFNIDTSTEIAVECDPRWTDEQLLELLFNEGVGRISIGVQDTDFDVQRAINRVQDNLHIQQLVAYAREKRAASVNLDLIYGLPHQTQQTFAQTLNDVIDMAPDRISLFNYAHLPERFAAQRKIREEWLPSAVEKLGLMQMAHKYLSRAGYFAIGLDHFALASDPLYQAFQQAKLHRNFQGYTHESTDILGLGASAISQLDNVIVQNSPDLNDYLNAIELNCDAHVKGITLEQDDIRRRYVISELMCNLNLDKAAFFARFNMHFDACFANELNALTALQADGIVELRDNSVVIPAEARLFARNVCSKFDAYLAQHEEQSRFSRAL